MFEIDKLLGELSEPSVVIDVDIDDNFDFNQKDVAFLIGSGSLLAYAGRKSVRGVRATQTFGTNDPIGFAEVIAGRARTVEYRKLSALRLRKFQANYLRTKVNNSNIFKRFKECLSTFPSSNNLSSISMKYCGCVFVYKSPQV